MFQVYADESDFDDAEWASQINEVLDNTKIDVIFKNKKYKNCQLYVPVKDKNLFFSSHALHKYNEKNKLSRRLALYLVDKEDSVYFTEGSWLLKPFEDVNIILSEFKYIGNEKFEFEDAFVCADIKVKKPIWKKL